MAYGSLTGGTEFFTKRRPERDPRQKIHPIISTDPRYVGTSVCSTLHAEVFHLLRSRYLRNGSRSTRRATGDGFGTVVLTQPVTISIVLDCSMEDDFVFGALVGHGS